MNSVPLREAGWVYIDELALIINRKQGTIRKWEGTNMLPKYLLPKRGSRGWRKWREDQVFGEKGIIAWMERNDMRPGPLLTDPDRQDEHLANLRKPKYLNGHHIKSVKLFIEKGKSREWIIKKIFPRTKYARPENLELALVKLFRANGWEFPPPTKKKAPKLPRAVEKELRALERRADTIRKQADQKIKSGGSK